MDRAAIWGGGSLGLLLAGRVAASGCETALWTRTSAQAEAVNKEGIAIEEPDGARAEAVFVRAEPIDEVLPYDGGLILLTVKQTALTPDFVDSLARIAKPGTAIALFQNGVGHVEKLREALPGRRLYAAVTTEGALRTSPSSVRHTGRGDIRLGAAAPLGERVGTEEQDESLAHLARLLNQAGFAAFLSNPLGEAVLRKLLVNSVINPLTAILRVRNGELLDTPERLALTEALFRESYGVLSEYGLSGELELWAAVRQVCEATAGNHSSMLQDVLAGKPTEIDAINGEIGRMAAAVGKDASLNKTAAAFVRALHPPAPSPI